MSAGNRSRAVVGAFLVVLAAVAWLIRPWLHGPFMLFYTYPAIIEALVVVFVGGYVSLRLAVPDRRPVSVVTEAALSSESAGTSIARQASRNVALAMAVLVVTLALGAAIVGLGGAYAQENVARTLPVENATHLPEVNADQPRILPRSVARQYASNSLQYPRYRLGPGDVSMRNGTPTWSFGLAPDGGMNNLLLTGKGATFVDMTTQGKRVDVVEADPAVSFGYGFGRGDGIVSNYRWKLAKGHYPVRYEDPVMVQHDGEIYMAVPYVKYAHKVRLTPVPVVYATPAWGGVVLVGDGGEIQHLSPEEARNSPVLAGQRLFPFDLARDYVNSMRYKRGLLNKWFVHEDELEIADVPGEGNDQPFLTVTRDEGLQYVVAAEPYGQAEGIYQVWLIDGRSGDVRRYQLPQNSALMGPRKAANYVRQENDKTDWDRFDPSEPLPTVINDTLYWEVRVVPTDSSGVAFVAFVDAGSGDVYTFRTDEKIVGFLGGSLDESRTEVDGNASTGTSTVIVIRDANGEVVNRVTVSEGQTIEIRPGAGNETAGTTTTTAERARPPAA